MQSDKVRDASIEGLLIKMYEHNFVEPQLEHCANKMGINYDKLPRNDWIFWDLMDQKAVKVDGHYELPLALKDEDIQLSNNWANAIKCQESEKEVWKRWSILQRVLEFYGRTDGEGICKKRWQQKTCGKTWYVPHHGVLKHNKGKVCITSYCSSQYRGASINKNLLSGPDLTNQLVGV